MAPSYLCSCGKALPEPLERVGASRAMCACGQQARLDDAAQAAYAERAGSHKPEPPRAAPPEGSIPPDADPAPDGAGGPDPAPAGASSAWSDAEISAEAQLPAEAEADVEVEDAPAPPPPRRAGDLASWVAG